MHLNAEQLEAIARSVSQEYDASKLPSGWPEDSGLFAPGTAVLEQLNLTLFDLVHTDMNVCKFTTPLVTGTRDYTTNRDMGRFIHAYVVDTSNGIEYPIKRTSEQELANEFGNNWRKRKALRPFRVFFTGLRQFTIDAEPTTSTMSLIIMATAPVNPLVNKTDYPTQMRDGDGNLINNVDGDPETVLPSQFHRIIGIGAGARILRSRGKYDAAKYPQDEYDGAKKDLRDLILERNDYDGRKIRITKDKSISSAGWIR